MAHIADGRFAQGVQQLEEAYVILPHPSVLYNIAKAWDDAGDTERALAAYERYLATNPSDSEEVRARIVALEKKRIAAMVQPSPNPTQPGPTPKPGDTTQPKPGDPPKPGQPKPGQPKPGQPKPGQPKPGQPKPGQPKPGDKPRPNASDDIYDETVITASRSAQSPLDTPTSTTIITQQDIRLSGITRIPELLRRVAGMEVMQITGGDTNVSMRGQNQRLSNKLLVLLNGRVVKNDLLGSTFWESLPVDVNQIERIEVVRGPGSSLYGADAFSGVVNILTKKPGKGGNGVRAGIGDHAELFGSLWTSGSDGNFFYRSSAGYTRYPRWTREAQDGRVDIKKGFIAPNLGAQNARIDVRTLTRIDKDTSLEFGGGYARSEINFYGIGPFNDYHVGFNTFDVSGRLAAGAFEVRSDYTLLDAFAEQDHDYVGQTLYTGRPIQHSFATAVEGRFDPEWPKGLKHNLLTGLRYRLKDMDWNYLIDNPPTEHHVGLYAQDAMTFADGHLGLTLSGRLDYVPILETVVPSGRATFIAKPGADKRQAFKASIATAFRTPTFLESYLDIPIQLPLSGLDIQSQSSRDDNQGFSLEAENILAIELGYINRQSDSFDMEITAYYNRIDNFIELAQPRLLTLSNLQAGIGGLNHDTGNYRVGFGGWVNQCSVNNVFGGEIGGRFYGVEGLDIFANYAINYGLLQVPDGCADLGDERTSHHKFNIGTQLRSKFGLEGEVTFHYQTGQEWGEQIATLDGIELRKFDLPGYHLLNGRVGFSFLKDKEATASVVLFNALSGVFAPAPQMHPFGNRVGRRFMAYFEYQL